MSALAGISVLVADDHPTFRSGVRAVLEIAEDITVVGEAADGAQAIDLARELKPDVVLLDLLMPGVGGVDACRSILTSTTSRVVILTMSSGDDTIFAALRAGATGYLLKDAHPDDIVTAVRAAANGQALLGGPVAGRVTAFFGSPWSNEPQPFPELTDREREVLDLLARGEDNAGIARLLFLSRKTVRNYVSQVLAKLGAGDRAEAIARARDAGLGARPTR